MTPNTQECSRKNRLDEEIPPNEKLVKADDDKLLDEPLHMDEDCNWAWVVFGAVFVGRMIVLGTLLTFSIYFAHYLEVFKAPRSVTGLIGSIMWFLYDLSSVINAFFVNRYGPRLSVIAGSFILTFSFLVSALTTNIYHLLLTQGILLGVGSNLINLSFVMSLKVYFRKHTNLTQGVSTTGAGAGVFLLGFIVPRLLENYGWRGAFVVHGAVLLHLCVVGAVIFPIRHFPNFYLAGNNKSIAKNKVGCLESMKILWKTRRFWLLVFSYFCFNFSYVCSVLLFKDFVTVRGLSVHFSVALIAFGGGDICGRLSSGILSSWPRINPVLLFSSIHSLCGCLLLLNMLVVNTGLALITVSFMFGFGSGCANGLFFVVPCHLYKSEIFLIAFACCSAFGGLGSIISTPLAGYIIDQTQSYVGALGMASAFSFAASILLLILFFSDRQSEKLSHCNYNGVKSSNHALT